MPFVIVKVRGGYKVKKEGGETFSSKPLTKEMATRQLRAIYATEKKKRK
jgi:hypothetical protein